MKIAIVGSRQFGNPALVRRFVRGLPDKTIVISGSARGVDLWAMQAALNRGLEVVGFPADWERYGKSAGMIRNQQIVDACDELVAFWDYKSKGTKNSIDRARKAGKRVRVFDVNGNEV